MKPALKILCDVLITGLLLAGLASLVASLVPFSVLLARVRSVSDSGQGTFFSPQFYHAMQTRLRLIGIANLAAGIILLGLRRQMYRWARRVLSNALILARDFCLAAHSLPVMDRLALAGLTFFAAALRIRFLSQPMRYDEAITYLEYSSRPFYVALSFYNMPNNHLFHTLLVRLAYLALGNHPWALRLPALLAGLCLVPATYAAARSLCHNGRSDTGGALFAPALVASSSMLIEYSTNARGYEIVCLLFMMMIPAGAYALRHRNWAAWSLLAVVSALGFYTIPIMLYPFGGVVLWLLFSITTGDAEQEDAHDDAQGNTREGEQGTVQSDSRSALAALFVAIVLTMLLTGELYSPVLAVSGPKALFANKWVSASPFPVFLHQLPASLVSTWRGWNRDLPTWLVAVLAVGFVISFVIPVLLQLLHRKVRSQRVPLALALLFCVGPLLLLQRVIPFERVWLFALPLYFICAAGGLAMALEPIFHRLHLRHAMALIALIVALFVGLRVERSGSVYLNNESRGMPALAAWLKGQLHSGDAIIAVPPSDGPLRYYLQREAVPTSYLNSSIGGRGAGVHRRLVVVNEALGDTVEQVCETAGHPHQPRWDAKLVVQFESAALYEVPFVPQDH
ncbi:MAG: glycosyltransferase family 39 protein [Candidatus Sulfotelmatobacter sp.]